MTSYTIRPLNTGHQYLDKSQYTTFRRHVGEMIDLPVFAFLIEGGGRKVLVDTGMADTERSKQYHHDGLQEPGQAIHEHMERLGIGLDEIEVIIFTHLHWDHCYNMKQFTKARYYVSEKEYRFALDPIPFYAKSYETPSLGIGCPWEGCGFNLVTGEEDILKEFGPFPLPVTARATWPSRFRRKRESISLAEISTLYVRTWNLMKRQDGLFTRLQDSTISWNGGEASKKF